MDKENIIKLIKVLQTGYIVIIDNEKEKKELFEKLNSGEVKHIIRIGEV